MKRWLACAALLLSLAPAWAAAPSTPVQTLTKQFTQQEQILLSGVLADPAEAAEFADDAAGPATQAIFDKWRQRIALFSRRYLDGPHPTDDNARSVQAMVPPAEWAMLMTSLNMLSQGGPFDQTKFRIFLAMLDNANDDLQADPPDTRNAHKVIALGRSKVTECMKDYLSSPAGQAALSEALRNQPQSSAAVPAPRIAVRPLKPRLQSKPFTQVQALIAADTPQADDKVFDGAKDAPTVQGPPAVTPVADPQTKTLPQQPLPVLTLPSGLDQAAALPPTPPPPPQPAPAQDDLAALRQKAAAEHHGFFATARVAVLCAVAGLFVGRVKRRRTAKKDPQPAGS